MKHRSLLPGIFATLGLLLLILDSKAAISSAAQGVDLCLRTVIPSLFPFFLLSGILNSSLTGTGISLLKPLGSLLGIPEGGESLLVSAFLGGYPVGAKGVADAWHRGALGKEDAERLLSFCSNAGPAFLFGMAAPLFEDPGKGWVLWMIHILSAVTVGVLLGNMKQSRIHMTPNTLTDLNEALKNALFVTAQVCGWVVIFRIFCGFCSRWFFWILPEEMQIALTGFLELTNGCLGLTSVSTEEKRFLMCSAMLSFGGVCVCLQTMSVTRGLRLRYYISGKLLQTALSLLYCAAYIHHMPFLWPVPVSLCLVGKKLAKRGGNPRPAVV